MQAREVWRQYRRALPFLRPYRGRMGLIIAVNLAATLAGLAQPYLSKFLIDGALIAHQRRMLWIAAGFMVGAAILGFGLNILSSYMYVRVSAHALFDMRLAVYRHLQALPPRYFARTKLGDIVSRLNNDIGEIQRVLTDTLLSVASSVLFLVGSAAAMIMLNWKLFVVGVVLAPLSVFVLRHFQARLARHVKTLRERSADIGSFLIETILGMRLVVSSGAEEREAARFGSLNERFVRAVLDMQLTSFMAGAFPGTILAVASATVFLYGGSLVIGGRLTVGGLVAFMAYHARLLSPVQSLMGTWTAVLTCAVSLERVFAILDTPPAVVELEDARTIENPSGELEFRSVSFRHDPEYPVLQDVSFRVEPGTICAIVGRSGAGKSTIADLILRFLDPDSGQILLDGHDLRSLKLSSLRATAALVDQSPFLFAAGIGENIGYANRSAGQAEIERAAQEAAIHDFIVSLPEGYQTKVAERGATLSAGQRQRIAIARALLRRPRLLVLDEPTAALDPAAEQEIAGTLVSLMGRQTTIVMTHRRSLVAAAGQVVVLENGRIAAQGRPADLLAPGGALFRYFGAGEEEPAAAAY